MAINKGEFIRNFIMEKFGVKTPAELTSIDIEGKYVIPIEGYDYNVVVVGKRIESIDRTEESQKKWEDLRKLSDEYEKLAENLDPGYENYCYHEDKQKVFYGHDWEEKANRFFTVEDLTTNYEKAKKRVAIRNKKEATRYKNLRKDFSIEDLTKLYKQWKEDRSSKDFIKFIKSI